MKEKTRWFCMWSVLVLFFVIILQSAPALASYEARVTNTTSYEVTVEVFEIRFLGVYESLGKKVISPGGVATFHTNLAFCLYEYVGAGMLPGQGPEVPRFQTFRMWSSLDGDPHCGDEQVKVIMKNNSFAITY